MGINAISVEGIKTEHRLKYHRKTDEMRFSAIETNGAFHFSSSYGACGGTLERDMAKAVTLPFSL
jgi:hypothetical protein